MQIRFLRVGARSPRKYRVTVETPTLIYAASFFAFKFAKVISSRNASEKSVKTNIFVPIKTNLPF